MREQQIQARILRELTKRGVYAVKVISASRNGTPDILCCHQGEFIGIEVKTPTGRVSKLQEHHLWAIRAAGGRAMVARSWEDVEKELF
jgi:Holliday junction resolvase